MINNYLIIVSGLKELRRWKSELLHGFMLFLKSLIVTTWANIALFQTRVNIFPNLLLLNFYHDAVGRIPLLIHPSSIRIQEMQFYPAMDWCVNFEDRTTWYHACPPHRRYKDLKWLAAPSDTSKAFPTGLFFFTKCCSHRIKKLCWHITHRSHFSRWTRWHVTHQLWLAYCTFEFNHWGMALHFHILIQGK